MNPFNLTGPDFLVLYAFVAGTVLPLAFVLRWYLRQTGEDSFAKDVGLGVYEKACLAGGAERVLHAALSRLVKDEALAFDAERNAVRAEHRPPGKLPEVERAVFAALDSEWTPLAEVRRRVAEAAAPIEERLRKQGLVLTPQRALLVRLLPALLIWAAAVFGGIKIMVGVSRHRPVEFLGLACMGMVAAGVFAVTRRPWRTQRGDLVLKRLLDRNAALELAASRDRRGRIGGADLALAVALFGVAVLQPVDSLKGLYTALQPPTGSGGGSCGSSGCGGGCGGGGCGGGGCGGCS